MILYPLLKNWKYVSPIVSRVPKPLLKLLAKAFVKFQEREVLADQGPKRIVLFVTKKCNLRCQHCFYIPHVSEADEMKLEEMQKMAESLRGSLKQVILTGGEPFLRNDLLDIVRAFDQNGCRTINIITNGTLTDKVREFLDAALKETKAQFIFMMSFDGPPAIHDEIRQVPLSADKTLKTMELLSEYYDRHPGRFGNIFFSTTINRLNLKHLPATVDALKDLKNARHSFSFARSADTHTFDAPPSSLSGFDVSKNILLAIDEMKDTLEYLDRQVWGRNASLFSLINRQAMVEMIRIMEKKPSNFRCLAGQTEVVIYPEGDVGICEMLKPVGNLKETDYDLAKFYEKYSAKFQAKKNCRCTHDCAIHSSIRFSPESLVEIIKQNKV